MFFEKNDSVITIVWSIVVFDNVVCGDFTFIL